MSDVYAASDFNGTSMYLHTSDASMHSVPVVNAGSEKKTLYVGNLDPSVTELMVSTVFSPFGQLLSVKIMRDANNRFDPYAFIEYADPVSANLALSAMNHIKFMDKELRVNWATSNQNALGKQGHSIFVGDLSLDVDDKNIHDAFMVYGPIIEAKVVRYTDGRSRGYAFICFENEADAEEAILKMDRSWLMGKSIRCNWATKKPTAENKPVQAKRYEDVLLESTVTNCTVYFGGIMEGLNEDLVREQFEEYAPITELKVFADKGFAFVKLKSHEVAAKAITEIHGREINNYQCKCAWGKENFSVLLTGTTNTTMPSTTVPASPGTSAAIAYNSGNNSANYDDYWRQYYAYCQQYYDYYQNYYGPSTGADGNNHTYSPSMDSSAGTSNGGVPPPSMGYHPPPPPPPCNNSFAPPRGPPPNRYRGPPPGFRPPPQPGYRPPGGPMRGAPFRPHMRGPYPPPNMRFRGPPPPGPYR